MSSSDDGAAALWAVLLVPLLVSLLLVVAIVVDVLAARSRAAASADLAALAAAPAAASSSPTACAIAGEVARANGGSLRTCLVGDGEVRVIVEVAWQGPWRRMAELIGDRSGAQAAARAGLR